MVLVTGERSNLLLHKAELTILSLPSLNVEKYSTVTVLMKRNETCIHTSQENKEERVPQSF